MDRRSFLKLLGVATAAAVTAPTVVVETVTAPAAAVAPGVVTRMSGGIRGLPYLVTESGAYFGVTRTPRLKMADPDAAAEPLTRCMMKNAHRKMMDRYATFQRVE